MSQTRFWAVSAGTVVRTEDDGSGGQGDGKSKRLYVGRSGSSGTPRNYKSFLKFTLDWTGVGKIVSATLVVYTDDQNGIMGPPGSTDTPKATVRRLTDSFTEGNNADNVFDSSDYTSAAGTTSDQASKSMAKAAGFVNRIDITGMVEDWAPSTVKRRSGKPGGKATNNGIGLYGTTSTKENWSGWSEEATDPLVRPQIELVYELGLTQPLTPTNLSPSGAVASIGAFQGDFSDPRASDKLAKSGVQVYTAAVTNTGQDINLNGGSLVYSHTANASNTEIVNGRFNHIPSDLALKIGTTYKWRVRLTDNEGQLSPWTNLVSFSVTNTNPNAPTPAPNGNTYASLNGVLFRGGTFSDPDGDPLLAYQVQLSTLGNADPLWDDADFLKWDTGKVYVESGSTDWQTAYGGVELATGTYHWRARQWDARDGVSAWAYATVTLSADFEPDPGNQSSVQIDPQAPWRIVIKAMNANGKRGPGVVVAILENAKSVGASIMYNSPGELHFTLPVDHPQISVIEPKQTHYSLQFYSGDGWREVYAGLVWDYDATEQDVVFYGIDYLALLDYVLDERYDPANPDKPDSKGGSKYVNKTVRQIVISQLNRAIGLKNSPVGFITLGSIATMNEAVTIWSTMNPTLSFLTGLLDSHRQGTGKKTRLRVLHDTVGFKFVVDDDPGVTRDNLRMKYGELVQGYRVIPFGDTWASLQHSIGRTREGIKVLYKSASAPGIDQSVWGRLARVEIMDGVSDENDLIRRTKQAAIRSGKLGKRIALGIRSGILQPLDGYNVCDAIPVAINHGVVNTDAFGSGYWVIFGVAWEASDNGATNTTLTLLPREDSTAPDANLIPTRPISPQAEWQVGWTPPNPLTATSLYWYDGNTGIVYKRNEDWATEFALTATASTDLVNVVAHGYVAGNTVVFGNLDVNGAGLTEGILYYVLASGLTANAFKVSLTLGGAVVDITADYVSGTVSQSAIYQAVNDGNMTPPETPSAPTSLAVTSASTLDSDGKPAIQLGFTFTPASNVALRGTVIQVTSEFDGATGSPIWTNAKPYIVPAGQAILSVPALGTTSYAARAYTQDVFGQSSAMTGVQSHTTVKDSVAPPLTSGVIVSAGVLGFLASWSPSPAADLAFYEFRYAPDNGSNAPDTDRWFTARAKTSFAWIGNLVVDSNQDGAADVKYWFEVRSVDTSGNVVTSSTDATPLNNLDFPDAGYSTAISVNPRLAGGPDIASGSITTDHIVSAGIDAAVIRTGFLRINTSDTTAADGVQVFDGASLVGFWNETGLYVYDSADPNDYIRVFAGGISVFLDGTQVTALSPAGLNASAITAGALPGGGNVVKNSSFELADFANPATVTATWDLAADWNASRVGSDTNVTTGAGALTETGTTY